MISLYANSSNKNSLLHDFFSYGHENVFVKLAFSVTYDLYLSINCHKKKTKNLTSYTDLYSVRQLTPTDSLQTQTKTLADKLFHRVGRRVE